MYFVFILVSMLLSSPARFAQSLLFLSLNYTHNIVFRCREENVADLNSLTELRCGQELIQNHSLAPFVVITCKSCIRSKAHNL